MVTTHGRRHPMITWTHKVTWQIKDDISPLPLGLWLPNLTWWRFIVKGNHPLSLLTLWSSYDVTNGKRFISTSARPWQPNFTESWVLTPVYYPSSHITCWWSGQVRSHDKWQMLYIIFHVSCCYHIWQKIGLWLRVKCPTTKPHIPSTTW